MLFDDDSDNPFVQAFMEVDEILTAERDPTKGALIELKEITDTLDKFGIRLDEVSEFIERAVEVTVVTARRDQGRYISGQSVCTGLLIQGILVGIAYQRQQARELEDLVKDYGNN